MAADKNTEIFEMEELRNFLGVLTAEADKNDSRTDAINAHVPLGEIDGGNEEAESARTNKKVLELLTEEKVLKSHTISSDLEDFDGEQAFIATAECTFSRKGLQQFRRKYSFIPKLSIEQDHDRFIILKTETEEIKIRKPRDFSSPDLFWRCVLTYQNQVITKERFEKFVIEMCSNQPPDFHTVFRKIVDDYGFIGNLKKLFFPKTSIEGVLFRNPVYTRDLEAFNITETKLKLSIKKLKDKTKPVVRKGLN